MKTEETGMKPSRELKHGGGISRSDQKARRFNNRMRASCTEHIEKELRPDLLTLVKRVS
jgi:hypothetical protein